MIKLIIFDFDGTTLNSGPLLYKCWKYIFDTFYPNIEYTDELINSFSGPPLKESIYKYFPHEDFDFVLKTFQERMSYYYKNEVNGFPEENYYLNKLKEDGYKLALFTNKMYYQTEVSLKRLEICGVFDEIVCIDQVKNPKPHPEGIYKILENLKIKKEEAIMVGDTKYDYDAAMNAGIKSIILNFVGDKFADEIKPIAFTHSFKEFYETLKEYNK